MAAALEPFATLKFQPCMTLVVQIKSGTKKKLHQMAVIYYTRNSQSWITRWSKSALGLFRLSGRRARTIRRARHRRIMIHTRFLNMIK